MPRNTSTPPLDWAEDVTAEERISERLTESAGDSDLLDLGQAQEFVDSAYEKFSSENPQEARQLKESIAPIAESKSHQYTRRWNKKQHRRESAPSVVSSGGLVDESGLAKDQADRAGTERIQTILANVVAREKAIQEVTNSILTNVIESTRVIKEELSSLRKEIAALSVNMNAMEKEIIVLRHGVIEKKGESQSATPTVFFSPADKGKKKETVVTPVQSPPVISLDTSRAESSYSLFGDPPSSTQVKPVKKASKSDPFVSMGL